MNCLAGFFWRAERLLLFIFSFSLSFCGDHEFNKASLRAKQLVSQFCFVVLVFEGNCFILGNSK